MLASLAAVEARARSDRSTPARPSITSRRSAGGNSLGQEPVRGGDAVVADIPRRVQADDDRLRDLAGPSLPHAGDRVEVLRRERLQQLGLARLRRSRR